MSERADKTTISIRDGVSRVSHVREDGKPATVEEHRRIHVVLHQALHELIADYLDQHPVEDEGNGLLPTTVVQLLQWSLDQTRNPTEPLRETVQ
jgi:hypothetical protein